VAFQTHFTFFLEKTDFDLELFCKQGSWFLVEKGLWATGCLQADRE
jgi:hypothetical protein